MQDKPITSPAHENMFLHIRGLVARVLLEHAGDGTNGQSRVAQRDIAAIVGTDWGTVHMSLKSMQDEGAIQIERHRLILNKQLLQKLAGI